MTALQTPIPDRLKDLLDDVEKFIADEGSFTIGRICGLSKEFGDKALEEKVSNPVMKPFKDKIKRYFKGENYGKVIFFLKSSGDIYEFHAGIMGSFDVESVSYFTIFKAPDGPAPDGPARYPRGGPAPDGPALYPRGGPARYPRGGPARGGPARGGPAHRVHFSDDVVIKPASDARSPDDHSRDRPAPDGPALYARPHDSDPFGEQLTPIDTTSVSTFPQGIRDLLEEVKRYVDRKIKEDGEYIVTEGMVCSVSRDIVNTIKEDGRVSTRTMKDFREKIPRCDRRAIFYILMNGSSFYLYATFGNPSKVKPEASQRIYWFTGPSDDKYGLRTDL